MDVFEEGNQADEAIVIWLALPWVEDDSVFGVLADMLGLCVDDNDL